MPTGYASIDAPLNISGTLFGKTDVSTPLVNMLGEKPAINTREFVCGADYELDDPEQRAVSEVASRTAPDAVYVERTQDTNITQMNHYAVDVTYRKESSAGLLSGVNFAGQTNNVPSELDFQIARQTDQMRLDMEWTVLNGTYNKAANKSQVDQTRGFVEAITTNVVDAAGAELDWAVLGDLTQGIADESPLGADGLLLVVNPVQKRQATNNIITVLNGAVPTSRTMGGASVTEVLTDFGTLFIMSHRLMVNGTAIALRMAPCGIVPQNTPGKGNFFYEELAKTGAATSGQIFGQWGLDHGLEWFHGKITNLQTTVEPVVS